MTRRRLRRFVRAGALAGVLGAFSAFAAGAAAAEVSFDEFKARFQPSDGVLLDREGRPLAATRIDLQARRLAWVPLDEVSPALIPALLAAEDRRFFDHAGVDWLAVASVLWRQLPPGGSGSAPRGASTISMQVAALLDPALARPGSPRSVGQKWDQMQAALAIERRWSKTQILEAYLNTVSFRGELQGLGAASRGLFDKAPSGLDRRESALLAALIRAPGASPNVVARRACEILAQAQAEAQATDRATCDRDALAAKLRHATLAPQVAEPLAPHTARRLVTEATTRRSSLDAGIQRVARDALHEQLVELQRRGVEDGAVVVLDNRTGQVLAHVGSSGGALSRAAQVDAADAPRQAGSTLKPFLYALAFERQLLTPATLLDDSPVALPTDIGLYTPRNYDLSYQGPVSVRRALGGSLNVPAVRTLTLTGVAGLHRLLTQLGLSTLDRDPEHYGWSLALGAADVTLLQLTNAYRALANGGETSALRWSTEEAPAPHRRVLEASSAWLVGHILADNAARAGTFGFDSVLATPFWTAVKTGTSKDLRDNWCIGFSEHYTVGVWVGNAGGAPMRNVSGVSGAAPAWSHVMMALHRTRPSHAPRAPAGVVPRPVAFERGLEAARTDWFTTAMAPPATGAHPYRVPLAQSAGAARITAPQDGMLLAWDPDIPAAVQGLVARHNGDPAVLQWVLNGEPLAETGARVVLPLVGGPNVLKLATPGGDTVDEVRFSVRGNPTDSRAGSR